MRLKRNCSLATSCCLWVPWCQGFGFARNIFVPAGKSGRDILGLLCVSFLKVPFDNPIHLKTSSIFPQTLPWFPGSMKTLISEISSVFHPWKLQHINCNRSSVFDKKSAELSKSSSIGVFKTLVLFALVLFAPKEKSALWSILLPYFQLKFKWAWQRPESSGSKLINLLLQFF